MNYWAGVALEAESQGRLKKCLDLSQKSIFVWMSSEEEGQTYKIQAAINSDKILSPSETLLIVKF